ncbi:phospholipid methyltransferase family protein [Catenaria anguillulae PL171]|uniref:Phosphatidyl-N-methylethanolamine N-methyltransferase n=1 Tax=Catenaria anguillulae PL171 TaxID=765915 RepID=A0A1Y2HD22_9FUNG|nr:phospholipid methyltransferase family protein [Catenaria anguillulae PL171]
MSSVNISQLATSLLSVPVLAAAGAIVAHVANYNVTAQIEYNTRIFTKAIGKNAIYFYAVYLILSALARDYVIDLAMVQDAGSLVLFPTTIAQSLGYSLFAAGILINLWTLKALGIKNMYNGDSFGFLMDEIVTGGPYQYWNDPQYVGTSFACLGYAIVYQSAAGYALAAIMWVVFQISVKFIEGPHLTRIYANRAKEDAKKTKKE